MNTNWKDVAKVLLIVALVLVAVKFWPLLAVPAFVLGVLILLLGGVAGLLALLLISAAVAIAGALLPLALPVLVIVGIVALIRSLTQAST